MGVKKSKLTLSGSVCEMSASEAALMVGVETVARLREADPEPKLFRFRTAYEGFSDGDTSAHRTHGFSRTIKKWLRSAVNGVAELMHPGRRAAPVPVYYGKRHNEPDRKQVGRVLASKLTAAEEGVAAEAVVYFDDAKLRADPPDRCSIEAEIQYETDGSQVDVLEVYDVSGLLTAHARDGVSPGFRGATLQEQVCLLATEGDTQVNIEEILAALKENPSLVNELLASEPLKTQLAQAGRDDKKNRKDLEAANTRIVELTQQVVQAQSERDAQKKHVADMEAKEKNAAWLGTFDEKVAEYIKAKALNINADGLKLIQKNARRGFVPAGNTDEDKAKSLALRVDEEIERFKEYGGTVTAAPTGADGKVTIPAATDAGEYGVSLIPGLPELAKKLGVDLVH